MQLSKAIHQTVECLDGLYCICYEIAKYCDNTTSYNIQTLFKCYEMQVKCYNNKHMSELT